MKKSNFKVEEGEIIEEKDGKKKTIVKKFTGLH